MTENLKNPLTAEILSTLCPGLGQLYCDRARRGTIIFTTVNAMNVILFICLYTNLSKLFFVCFWIAFITWGWNVSDAKVAADLYNQRALLRTVETH